MERDSPIYILNERRRNHRKFSITYNLIYTADTMETLLSIDKDVNSESFLDCGSRITKLEMYGNDIMNKIASAGFEE